MDWLFPGSTVQDLISEKVLTINLSRTMRCVTLSCESLGLKSFVGIVAGLTSFKLVSNTLPVELDWARQIWALSFLR